MLPGIRAHDASDAFRRERGPAGMRLLVVAAVFGLLGGIFLIAGLVALMRARPLRFAIRTLTGLLLLALGGLAGAITLGMTGYRALTREEVAALVVVRPVGPQRFAATFHVPGRPEVTFELAGD